MSSGDDYRPRRDDHEVEPLFGGLRGAGGEPPGPGAEPQPRASGPRPDAPGEGRRSGCGLLWLGLAAALAPLAL